MVVCGTPHTDRVTILPPVPERPIRARIGVGKGGSLSVHGIHSELPGGNGNGAAVTLTLPF